MLWNLLENLSGHTDPAISLKRYDTALPETHLKKPPVIPYRRNREKSMLPHALELARKTPQSYRSGDFDEKV